MSDETHARNVRRAAVLGVRLYLGGWPAAEIDPMREWPLRMVLTTIRMVHGGTPALAAVAGAVEAHGITWDDLPVAS